MYVECCMITHRNGLSSSLGWSSSTTWTTTRRWRCRLHAIVLSRGFAILSYIAGSSKVAAVDSDEGESVLELLQPYRHLDLPPDNCIHWHGSTESVSHHAPHNTRNENIFIPTTTGIGTSCAVGRLGSGKCYMGTCNGSTQALADTSTWGQVGFGGILLLQGRCHRDI